MNVLANGKLLAVAALLISQAVAASPSAAQVPLQSDTPSVFRPPVNIGDFERRVVMIPMRDGVKLHTVIMVPKGASRFPILLTRTPYNADKATSRTEDAYLNAVLIPEVNIAPGDDYIRVVQDIRGKYGSEGDYVMTRPPRGPLNASGIDESTDAWDTIEWLVHNIPETNGRVGMIGGSYDGWLIAMALLDPHPALKVAVPIAPMVDGWKGDDWFHNGAFRQEMMSYIYDQEATRGNAKHWPQTHYDDYEMFLKAGSAGHLGEVMGLGQLGFWNSLLAHPSYDAWWQAQAVDRLVAAGPNKVPTLWISGRWDQEDIYGGPAAYQAIKRRNPADDNNFLVMGPWYHMQTAYDGNAIGPINFAADTSLDFRTNYLRPFLEQYLRDGAPPAHEPPVLSFETGTNRWKAYHAWPPVDAQGMLSLYLEPGLSVGFDQPKAVGSDSFVSDPAKPVPYHIRPDLYRHREGATWKTWLVDDQRPFSDRPDVLTYTGPVLETPVRVLGSPSVDLFAATTGTDVDWVVKLIDVYPDEVPAQPPLGGYQLPIAMDIFRGRYREDPAHPKPIKAGATQEYRFLLPNVDHVFLPGHRIMIQIQSTWFPLYDRNPQSFVESIFNARPEQYRKATQTVSFGGVHSSRIVVSTMPISEEVAQPGSLRGATAR
jgi:putative CocE/NonD family hydrolase